jgi:hypothetical protein
MTRMMTRSEASAYLLETHGVSRTTAYLAKLAVTGGGPQFRKLGKKPYYTATDLDDWIAAALSKAVTSTSELRKNPFLR